MRRHATVDDAVLTGLLRGAADRHQVAADAEKPGLVLQTLGRVEYVLPGGRVCVAVIEVGQQTARSLEAEHLDAGESGGAEFSREFLGPVQVGQREPLAVVRRIVSASGQPVLDQLSKSGQLA